MAPPNPFKNATAPKGRLDAQVALSEATRLILVGKTPRTEQVLHKLLKIDPNNAEGLHLAGVARYRAGKVARTRDLIEKAVRADPADA